MDTMKPYKATHYTIEPRISNEKTVEEVELESSQRGTVRFTRVGECVDVWAFEEYEKGDETITDWKEGLTRQIVGAVLKTTPCVEIRTSDTMNATTIGKIEYSAQLEREKE